MSQLKMENLDNCFSLLREYLREGPSTNKKGAAILALNQLQKITAGTVNKGIVLDNITRETSVIICTGVSRLDGSPNK